MHSEYNLKTLYWCLLHSCWRLSKVALFFENCCLRRKVSFKSMKPPEQHTTSIGLASNNLNLNLFWQLQSNDMHIRLRASQQLTSTLQMQLNEMVGCTPLCIWLITCRDCFGSYVTFEAGHPDVRQLTFSILIPGTSWHQKLWTFAFCFFAIFFSFNRKVWRPSCRLLGNHNDFHWQLGGQINHQPCSCKAARVIIWTVLDSAVSSF